jgi:hypothetical protein
MIGAQKQISLAEGGGSRFLARYSSSHPSRYRSGRRTDVETHLNLAKYRSISESNVSGNAIYIPSMG